MIKLDFSGWMYGLSRPKSKFLPLSRHFCITSWFDDDVTRITSIGGMDGGGVGVPRPGQSISVGPQLKTLRTPGLSL